ncbi:MAG: TadE/TadG family type IV pilus assembly protein [Pseudolabrys sp.]
MLESLWSSMSRLLRRFKSDRKGNVAITFALATLPIIGFVGTAVDYSSANAAKADLQAALDSTALMLAKYAPSHTDAEIQSKASAYFKAIFDAPNVSNISLKATYTASPTKIVVDGSAEVPTTFMAALGIDHVTIKSSSTTTWGTTRLRVALVLDNTGSMADNGKMTALKSATKSLLSQLKAAANNDGDVYVSIIPFAKDVNVGSTNYAMNWIDWTEWDQKNQSCSGGWGGGHGGWGWGWGNGNSNNGNGNGWSCSAANHNTWTGCITDRGPSNAPGNSDWDQVVTKPDGTTDSLWPAEQYGQCPVEMMGLSYNWASMNSLVDSMTPNGSTNQPIGLVWGWQSLVGGGPLVAPLTSTDYEYKKIIILLSDGLNTEDRWYGSQTAVDNRMYQTGNGSGTCANIKAAGITIYTIQVDTGGDPKSTLLENCASSSDKFYLLTKASDIAGAFTSIGTELTKLRVSK